MTLIGIANTVMHAFGTENDEKVMVHKGYRNTIGVVEEVRYIFRKKLTLHSISKIYSKTDIS